MYTNVIVNVLYNSAIYIKHMYYKEKFAQNPQQKSGDDKSESSWLDI